MLKKSISATLIILMLVMAVPTSIFAASDTQGPDITYGIGKSDTTGTIYGSDSQINSLIEVSANDIPRGDNGVRTMSIQWNNEETEIRNGFSKIYTKLRAGTLKITATDYLGNTSSAVKTYSPTSTWREFSDNTRPNVIIQLDSGTYNMYDNNGALNKVRIWASDTESNLSHISYNYEYIGGNKESFDSSLQKEGAILVDFPSKAGTYVLHAYAADRQLNYSVVATRTFTIIDNSGSTQVETPDYAPNTNYNGFGAWLRTTRYTSGKDFILNNYVQDGSVVEYIVEYYNNRANIDGVVKINLTIPNDAALVSATAGGTGSKVNGQLVVTWPLTNLAAQAKGKLRVSVKYGPDATANPTKIIYPVMTANAGTTELTRSGVKHLYINPNSSGTVYHRYIAMGNENGYLEADRYITRAEFAQVLYNAGLIGQSGVDTNAYKRYSDAGLLDNPSISYSKKAVSALAQNGIAIGDQYGNYNPNQAITYAEIETIVGKIVTQGKELYGMDAYKTSVFKFQNEVNVWWASFSTEMVRLNVNENYIASPMSNITRREMLKMLNRALMRGPIVENYKTVPTVVDLPRSDRDYLELVEATVSHYAGYNSTLQEVWK